MWMLLAGYVLMVGPQAQLTAEVAILNDPDFPPVTLAQANAMLQAAQDVLRTKTGFEALAVHVNSKLILQEFIQEYAPPGSACMQVAAQRRVRPNDPNHFINSAAQFLKKWSLDDLRVQVPDLPPGPLTYEMVASNLTHRQAANYVALGKLKTPAGKPLLSEATTPLRSFAVWACAIAQQDLADIFITNTALINDIASEPSPHGVTRGALRVGASTAAYDRQAFGGRAVVLSTFPVVGPFKDLREPSTEGMGDADKLHILSRHVLAHELAHAIFRIPDVYDHPLGCLMTTRPGTTWPAADAELTAHPEPCTGCAPYVEAKRHVWAAAALAQAGKVLEAVDQLQSAIRSTPAHVDGSYNAYTAGLFQQLALLYDAMHDRDKAVRMVGEAALRFAADPPARLVLHPSTKQLYDKLLRELP